MSDVAQGPVTGFEYVNDTYGEVGLEQMQELLTENPCLPLAEVISRFSDEPKNTWTFFFREPSMQAFAEEFAPDIARSLGRPLRIGEIGCSTGEETWTLAALLRENGVTAHIDAYDVSTRVLEQAQNRGPYPHSSYDFRSRPWLKQDRYFRHFVEVEEVEEGIAPADYLAEHVDFKQLDAIGASLEPPEAYDVLLVYNLLWHYPEETRDVILKNVLAGLKPGGHFLFEGPFPNGESQPDYQDWATDLTKFGLHRQPHLNMWQRRSILVKDDTQEIKAVN